ncbi:Retinoic acid induced 16-like protein [Glomus cerebriforme]|uniref:Retinoic acid induced 16-like protein n=1 Tax=Glomus cerebriforme TaxID=658196 RepID=A0A397S2N2_9GLOM|nr:Retinoic acid induced 16-like protein [Glomus cerebriforme]
MFLSRIVNHAIEIIAPHIKSKEEELHEEWKSVRKYFNSISTRSKEQNKFIDINSTKIPGNLENIIRFIKEEEIRIRIKHGSISSNNIPFDENKVQRKCIEFILSNNVLKDLIGYAKDDIPKGMTVQVLKFFIHFVQNIPPKLLIKPEIYSYIQRLILISYELDVEDNHYLKQELVKLIHVVCRQMINHPELIDIYFERSKGIDFPIFSMLLDYMNIIEQTGKVSREALYLIINMLKDDKDFLNYLIKESKFFKTLEKRLQIAFATLPNNNRLIISENNNGSDNDTCSSLVKRFNKKRTPSEMLQYTNASKPEIAVEEFFEFWQFINKIAGINSQILMSQLLNSLINGFIKYSIIPAILSPSDEQATAATIYLSELIKYIKIHQILDSIFNILLGGSLEPENTPQKIPQSISQEKSQEGATTQVTSLREILIERCSNAEDRLSLSTLRLFDSILETFNQFALYNLVLRNLTHTAMANNTVQWNKKNPRVLLRKLLSLMPLDDRAGSDISVVVESADKVNDNGFGYEDYFLDAQRQVQLVALACNHWTNPYLPPNTTNYFSDCTSEEDNNTAYIYEGTFINMIFEQLKNFLQVPLERNLVLTSIISKLACILDEKIDLLLYGNFDFDNSNSPSIDKSDNINIGPIQKNLINVLEKLANEAEIGASKVPNFQTRIQLVKRRGMNNSRLSYGSTDTSNNNNSPISPSHSIELNSPPTSPSMHINPFAKFTNFVNAFIVLQEFCKELAAIVFVKYMDLDQGVMIVEEEEDRSNNDTSNSSISVNTMTEEDIILMRNREKFARLVALVERQQERNTSNDGNRYRGRKRSNTIGGVNEGTNNDNNGPIIRQWSLRERRERRMTHTTIIPSPLNTSLRIITNVNRSATTSPTSPNSSPLQIGLVRKGSLSKMKGLTKKSSLEK